MKTLTTTLMLSAVASLLAFPVMGQDAQTEDPTRNELTYRHENVQGEVNGDRLMQRDRAQVRLQTQDPDATDEPLKTRDRTRQQDQVHDPDMAADQSQDAAQLETREQVQTQTRSRLMQDRTDAVGSQLNSMNRGQHSFTQRSLGSRTSTGAGRR